MFWHNHLSKSSLLKPQSTTAEVPNSSETKSCLSQGSVLASSVQTAQLSRDSYGHTSMSLTMCKTKGFRHFCPQIIAKRLWERQWEFCALVDFYRISILVTLKNVCSPWGDLPDLPYIEPCFFFLG